jgi:hypothetical protein
LGVQRGAGQSTSKPAYNHLSHQFQWIQLGLTLSDKSNAGYHNVMAITS